MTKDKDELLCPKHRKPLIKKRVVYGMPATPDSIPENCIIGGCLYREDRPFGYECPEDGKVYFLDDGKLVPQYEDHTAEQEDDNGKP